MSPRFAVAELCQAFASFVAALLILLALSFAIIEPAQADSWAMPETKSYTSPNGQFRLTIVPRELDSRLAYFGAKSRGESLPEQSGPVGQLEQLRDGKWVQLWTRMLVNEVAPVTAVVTDDGRRVVTFDNWHSVGLGDHVVVLYGPDGTLVRSIRLDQIVPPFIIDGLPRSVGSTHWRDGEPRIVHQMIELAVPEPREDLRGGGSFTIRIALEDGRVEPIAHDRLAELRPRFCAAHADQVRSFNAYIARERADLILPASDNKDDWSRYIYNAVRRLVPRDTPLGGASESDSLSGIFGETAFELLDAGVYMEEDFRNTFREALTAPLPEEPRRWFASRNQGRMVAEVERTAKQIKPGQLAGVEMRFFADGANWPRIRDAMTTSGAQLVQVDPSVPIPPRAEDIAELPPERTIDPSCATPAPGSTR